MQTTQVKELLEKYAAGQCTEAEKASIERWYLQMNEEGIDLSQGQIEKIGLEIWENLPLHEPAKRLRIWPGIAAAASILLCLAVGSYVLVYQHKTSQGVYASDIKPGSNRASLTLANGKRIVLAGAANGLLASQSGVQISKTADGQLVYTEGKQSGKASGDFNTVETPRGGQYQVVLPDGTRVWLNAASSLRYPASFASLKERKVELRGEGYFEVAHNKVLPFRVASGGQVVEVLGTHFNVSAYAEDGVLKTTLLEGSVRVSAGSVFKVIRPGEQAIFRGADLQVSKVDVEGAVAWKNGDFVFSGETLESIMTKVARWYDVKVEYERPELRSLTFNGTMTRFGNVSKVLRMMELTGHVHFKVQGNTIRAMN